MIADFKQQTAVITGAGSGIGRATALAFAREGAEIVVSDINPERAERVAREIVDLGGRAIGVRCDVSQSSELQALREAALDAFGRITILMNNAGIVISGPFLEVDMQNWRRSVEINLFAVIEATQLMLPDILKAGTGHIINVASVAALYPYNVDRMSYNAARAAVVSFSESLAMDLWTKGIGVTLLCPGPTRTNMIENMHFIGEPALTAPDLPLTEPEVLGEKMVAALRSGTFFVPGNEEVHEIFARRGANPDAFLREAAEKIAAKRGA
jgi:NAD(P)-dependent dehydrogenase (short-subunit alcohol dehydrogenase family)